MRTVALYTIALLALSGCSHESTRADSNDSAPTPNQGIVAGTLVVTAARPTLTLRNTTAFVVGYMVVDKDQMTIALYPPCGVQCAKLVQGADVSVPYASIAGYTSASTEANVLWFTYARAADGTLTPQGPVQTTRVKL
jgi:hypothetical protein